MDIMSMTAVELGKKIRAGELSAEEAVEAAFLRIEKTEKDVHGFLALDKERALKRARQVQKQIKEGTMAAPLAVRHGRFHTAAEFLLRRDWDQADVRHRIAQRTYRLCFFSGSDRSGGKRCDRLCRYPGSDRGI